MSQNSKIYEFHESTRNRFEIRTISAFSFCLKTLIPLPRRPHAGTFPTLPYMFRAGPSQAASKPDRPTCPRVMTRVSSGSSFPAEEKNREEITTPKTPVRVFLNPTSRLSFTILNLSVQIV